MRLAEEVSQVARPSAIWKPVREASTRCPSRLHRSFDRYRPGSHAVLAGAARHVRRMGAGDQRFGRDAAVVHASAAELSRSMRTVLIPRIREADGKRRAGLSGAHYDRVKLHCSLPMAVTDGTGASPQVPRRQQR